jgi:hypothetical protein
VLLVAVNQLHARVSDQLAEDPGENDPLVADWLNSVSVNHREHGKNAGKTQREQNYEKVG